MITAFLLNAQIADAYDQAMVYKFITPQEDEKLSDNIAKVLLYSKLDHGIIGRMKKWHGTSEPAVNTFFKLLESTLLADDQLLLEVSEKIVALLPQLEDGTHVNLGAGYISKWYKNGKENLEKVFVESLKFLITSLEGDHHWAGRGLIPGYNPEHAIRFSGLEGLKKARAKEIGRRMERVKNAQYLEELTTLVDRSNIPDELKQIIRESQ